MLSQVVNAFVYRLYRNGFRLPRPQQAVEGALRLIKGGGTGNLVDALKAELLMRHGGTAAALPPLYHATVTRITGNGIVIHGTEIIARRTNNKASADHHRQAWWCLIATYDIAAEDVDLDALDVATQAQLEHAQAVVRGEPAPNEKSPSAGARGDS